ncbi:transcriptional regulator [Paenibacillus sp. BIHB 4019]|uniref:Transcriptional regulator n=1 Tax=Paenibacillus sp. BIHB 4019 TaxID=1870819 RepID=A0A1B2DD31_9BACL|nr:SUMF1/EgtB/PvdO family nonheme iron enzyme [Paenibacillus sp. BIHB 4019]ANY65618.1 transcriptional regulator [Paenibacillus sp. BIHB 4019]
MRKRFIFLLPAILLVVIACSQEMPEKTEKTEKPEKPEKTENNKNNDSLVFVEGGNFVNTKSNFYGKGVTIPSFYIDKYEVTQQEWVEVMGSNPSGFKGDHLPVEMVSWYDVVEYCNKRSIKEGLKPYYEIDKNKKDPSNKSDHDNLKWTVTINEGASGYRLPTEAEWEYAAGGGQVSHSYTYSGSNNVDEVAWYWKNAGDKYLSGEWNWTIIESNKNKTKSVGAQKPNELGLYDMSGNVREWCWNWYGDGDLDNESGSFRVVKGGGWIGDVRNNELSYRGKFEANGIGPDQGFRVSRAQ